MGNLNLASNTSSYTSSLPEDGLFTRASNLENFKLNSLGTPYKNRISAKSFGPSMD